MQKNNFLEEKFSSLINQLDKKGLDRMSIFDLEELLIFMVTRWKNVPVTEPEYFCFGVIVLVLEHLIAKKDPTFLACEISKLVGRK